MSAANSTRATRSGLVAIDGTEIGRGLTRLGALDVARSAGKKGAELEIVFGNGGSDAVVVHKDDLVVQP